MTVLKGKEPEKVFHYFEGLAQIPHGSGNTKALSDWICNFAMERNLEYYQDDLNNVIIIKGATAGYENSGAVILQGHMDMVCEKEPKCSMNMEKDALNLKVDGDVIYAEGTTLGGDNGIAVAMMMALLDDDSIDHPRIECIFTVDEETGLYGAEAIDVSMLKGRKYINLDSEDEGIVTISCAGGASSNANFDVKREPCQGKDFEISIGGLTGGHSGMEINKGYANANKLMARLLFELYENVDARLVSIDGGSADNVITKACNAVVKVKDADSLNLIIKKMMDVFKHENKKDPGLSVSLAEKSEASMAMTKADTLKVIGFANCTPNGVEKMTDGIAELPQTSLNLGIVSTTGDDVRFVFGVRSSVDSECYMLCQRLKNMTIAFGGRYSEYGNYPGWEYDPESKLKELVCEVFKEHYGKDMVIEAIHAGLECGFFAEKIPGLDCVSIGPDVKDVHTPNEKLYISSTKRVWDMLLKILVRLK